MANPEAEPERSLPQVVGRDGPPTSGPTALQRYQAQYGRFDELDEETISLQHYLEILLRRKWLVLSVAGTVLVVAALQVFTTTPLYRATAQIQVDPEGENVLPYEEFGTGRPGSQLEEYVWTQTEKLQAKSLDRRVAAKVAADASPELESARQGVLIDSVQGARALARTLIFGRNQTEDQPTSVEDWGELAVRPLRNTRLIEVSYESPDPAFSAQVVNILAEEFIEQHLEGKFEATTRATEFLAKQLDDLQISVEESEAALIRYAQQNNIVNVNDRDTIARKTLADLSDEVTRARGELIVQRARYAALPKEGDVESFPDMLKTEELRRLDSHLAELEGDLAGLSSQYGSEWPAIKTLRTKLAEVEQQIRSERRQAIANVAQEYQVAQSRFRELEAAVNEQRVLVDVFNEDSIQYNILKRESESNKQLYEGLLQRMKEAGVAAGLRSSNIRVADPAEIPDLASAPRTTRALALALVLGLFLGVGAALAVESLDNTVKNTEEISIGMGLPALGVVPHLSLTGETQAWSLWPRRRERFGPILAFKEDLERSSRNRGLEAYRSLRTALLLSHSSTPPQTILVTSAMPSDGKTTTSVNLAVSLAQTGARTLLVDLDMRNPSLEEAFGVSKAPGMSSYLTGNSELGPLIKETLHKNLYLLGAGPVPPNPAELVGSERMAAGLQLVREYFSYVVIDSPPSLELADALILAPQVDGVMVVVRGGRTPKKALDAAANRILGVGGTLLGVLINDVDLERSGYGYYGPYSYYGKGNRYFRDDLDDRAEASA